MLKKLFALLEGLFLFGLAFTFLRWYIRGSFGKYWYWFWLNTILAFGMYYDHHNSEHEWRPRTFCKTC